jgi:hypothetical protein
MKCEDCRARMPEYWEDELTDEQRAEVELHLTSCAACRDEAAGLSDVWHALERIPAERPGRELRSRFYQNLEAYQNGFAEAGPRVEGRGRAWWGAGPVAQIGLAAAMLAVGFGIGFSVDNKRDNTQLAQLRNEVGNMRQMVTLSLLQQQNASDRLKGVNWAYRFEQPDTEVLAALLHTVNHDQSVDVRLAAVDALRAFGAAPIARKGMVQAIRKQESPMVQIALIDQLTELKDREAVPVLQGLAKDSAVNEDVRRRAQSALGKLLQ